MAEMYPERLSDRVRSDRGRRAEVRLYDAFAEHTPADWRVAHSVAWLSREAAEGARDGEADFVVIHPDRGLLVIEVKGGGIDVDGRSGTWWSTDAEGQRHEIHDPFQQAMRSKHALIEQVRELPAFRDRWVAAAHAVAFPDLSRLTAPLGPHAPPEITIGADDVSTLADRIEAIYRFSQGAQVAPLGEAQAEDLARMLAPRAHVRAPLAVRARDADRAILALTEEQFDTLDLLSRLPRVSIDGPAGSGKSLLAEEQARRLAEQGFRTLFVCFNRLLAETLRARVAGEGGGPEVHTFHDLCYRVAYEAGLIESRYVENPPPEFFERLPDLLLEGLHALPEFRYDAIIVDEGQDFSSDWWALLELALADAGPEMLFVFHDDAQRLTEGEASLPAGLSPIPLTKNVRNTQHIHRVAFSLTNHPADRAVGPEGDPVELVELADPKQLQATLSRILHRLVQEERFRPEEIAILTGRGRASTALADLDRIGAFRCGALPVHPGVVAVETLRRFKGLDSAVVILVEFDHLRDQREMLYTAITRARTHLVVVGEPETLDLLR